MRQKPTIYFAILCSLFIGFLLTGCDGGGGSGSSTTAYTGLTTQAEITDENAEEIATNASAAIMEAQDISGQTPLSGVISTDASGFSALPTADLFKKVSYKFINELDKSSSDAPFTGEVYKDSDTMPGECGGTAAYSGSYDDLTNTIRMEMSFQNYCEYGTTINGKMILAGKAVLDPYSDEMQSMDLTLTLKNIETSTVEDSVTMSGTIGMQVSETGGTMTMDLIGLDNVTGKTAKLENVILSMLYNSYYATAEIEGRFYEHDYGYVDISTETAITIYESDYMPSGGAIVISGKNGIAGGSTKARITYLTDISYRIEADTTGDGVYNHDSGTLYWN